MALNASHLLGFVNFRAQLMTVGVPNNVCLKTVSGIEKRSERPNPDARDIHGDIFPTLH